jgi:hypothetical protein
LGTKLSRDQSAELVAELKLLPELEVQHRLKGNIMRFKLALLF